MRSATAILFVLLFCSIAKAQYTITPGVGIDNALLGIPVKNITRIIGEPLSVLTFQQEKDDWTNFGYDVPSDKLVFAVPFDHVYVFSSAANIYAIWKIYTRNDTAVIFNLSSYQADKFYTDKINIGNGLRFYDDSLAVKKVFGSDFEKKIDEANNNHVIFKDKGIFFIVNENQVRNVFILPAVKPLQVIPDCPPEQFLYTLL